MRSWLTIFEAQVPSPALQAIITLHLILSSALKTFLPEIIGTNKSI